MGAVLTGRDVWRTYTSLFSRIYPEIQIAESKGVRHFPRAFGHQPSDATNVEYPIYRVLDVKKHCYIHAV